MLLDSEVASTELSDALASTELLPKSPKWWCGLHPGCDGLGTRSSTQGCEDLLGIVHDSFITGRWGVPWIGSEDDHESVPPSLRPTLGPADSTVRRLLLAESEGPRTLGASLSGCGWSSLPACGAH